MIKIREAIVVEGRYDKNTLSQVVDTVILQTDGFGIMKDKQQQKLLRSIAEKRGIVIFTDSDGAGFVIRNFLKGVLPTQHVKHAYIPDVFGKEKRKTSPGKEGKLGVEGMTTEVLYQCLQRAGVTFLTDDTDVKRKVELTKQDLFDLGLSGGSGSSKKRALLLKKLDFPEHMSSNAMFQALKVLYSYDELVKIIDELGEV